MPAAFLRTLVHEAGHALNLFHPKHDVHVPGIGTEIMNQTGDVIGFATAANPYPGNAAFAFSQHDRTSLIHSPDPQVRPGWKELRLGARQPVRGSARAGRRRRAGQSGRRRGPQSRAWLPSEVYVGQYVVAEVVLTNTGDVAREVSRA